MSSQHFPAPFADLEPFVPWALGTEAERARKRRDSTMVEIQAFYDAILPRMEAILDYLNPLPLENLPADAQGLMNLTLALAEVSTAVELFKQPLVADGYDPERFIPAPGQ
ncbi:MAG: hypothetical protein AB7G75_30430 [Candidatus Binatia bacterium]